MSLINQLETRGGKGVRQGRQSDCREDYHVRPLKLILFLALFYFSMTIYNISIKIFHWSSKEY